MKETFGQGRLLHGQRAEGASRAGRPGEELGAYERGVLEVLLEARAGAVLFRRHRLPEGGAVVSDRLHRLRGLNSGGAKVPRIRAKIWVSPSRTRSIPTLWQHHRQSLAQDFSRASWTITAAHFPVYRSLSFQPLMQTQLDAERDSP